MINTPPSGFAAINSQRNGSPYAIRKVIIGPNGQPMTVIVDARTGQQLSSMNGYTIMENNYVNPNTLQPNTSSPEPSAAEEVVKQQVGPKEEKQKFPTRGEQPTGIINGDSNRSQANNFGYIDKPGIVKAASFAPGVLGLAGKAINLGINTNNALAANAMRDAMDVPAASAFGFAKDIVKDNKGQAGVYNIGDNPTSIGMPALSPTGVTNMLPEEAAKRAAANKVAITPATKQQVREQNKAARETKKQGVIQSMLDDAKNFFDSLFNSPTSSGGSSRTTNTGGYINTQNTHRSDQEGNISGEGGIDSFGGGENGDPASDDRL